MTTRDDHGNVVATKRLSGRRWRALADLVLRTSDVCHLCGHPGADAVDHVIPLARGGTNALSNLRPAHHTDPCPTCGKRCNRVKGSKIAPEGILRRSGSLTRPK